MGNRQNIQTEKLRHLVDAYFNATLTEEESRILTDFILKSDSGSDYLTGDEFLDEEIRIIRTLHAFSVTELESITPKSLESDLDRHISKLARAARFRFRKIYAAVSAAAAVVLIVIAGINYNTFLHSDSSSVADSLLNLPELTLSVPESRDAEPVAKQESGHPLLASAGRNVSFRKKQNIGIVSKKTVKTKNNEQLKLMAESNEILKATNESLYSKFASVDESLAGSCDIIETAIVNPVKLMEHPIARIGQGHEIVSHSFSMVRNAFSGVDLILENAAKCVSGQDINNLQ